ncbi:LysR substrate-binding domain-containing protein, partial [Citreicella sp. C3M06]|uniref:LysR substrate-binding domain-containing protein n=1 Tax=Citreicella sp. C3M06 TaxID=2841564 RepID=UPI00352ED9D1
MLVVGAECAAAHPAELEDWDWPRYRHRSEDTRLAGPDGEEVKILGQARLEVDSIDALAHFACQNLGATVLPEHLAARGEAEGTLVRLLPGWQLAPLRIVAVRPDTSRRENLARLLGSGC